VTFTLGAVTGEDRSWHRRGEGCSIDVSVSSGGGRRGSSISQTTTKIKFGIMVRPRRSGMSDRNQAVEIRICIFIRSVADAPSI
jgi:hypothetical protein